MIVLARHSSKDKPPDEMFPMDGGARRRTGSDNLRSRLAYKADLKHLPKLQLTWRDRRRLRRGPPVRSAGLRKWPFVRSTNAETGPRGPACKIAESRLYERDMPDLFV
jgi:hypothetical protein